MPHRIPPRVRALLAGLTSIAEVEALLLVHERGGEWTADRLAREARIAVSAAEGMMRSLQAMGILAAGPGGYRYEPVSPEVREGVEGLARAYHERPFLIVNLIHSHALEDVRTLSDAFLLRKGREEDEP